MEGKGTHGDCFTCNPYRNPKPDFRSQVFILYRYFGKKFGGGGGGVVRVSLQMR